MVVLVAKMTSAKMAKKIQKGQRCMLDFIRRVGTREAENWYSMIHHDKMSSFMIHQNIIISTGMYIYIYMSVCIIGSRSFPCTHTGWCPCLYRVFYPSLSFWKKSPNKTRLRNKAIGPGEAREESYTWKDAMLRGKSCSTFSFQMLC